MDIAPSNDLAVRFGAQILQGEKPSPLQGNGRHNSAGGLLLGQRELVVVSVDHGDKITPVRLVNHGDQQKEATRRLFDAHVYAQSFRRESDDNRDYVNELRAKLKKAEQETVLVGASRVPIGTTLDLEKLDVKTSKPSQWLQSDSDSRDIVKHFVDNILKEGTGVPLTRKGLNDQLWLMMEAGVNKWSGGPDEELVKQAQASEARARKATFDALKDSSEVRKYTKTLERQFKELQKAHQDLQRASRGSVPPGVAHSLSEGAVASRPSTSMSPVRRPSTSVRDGSPGGGGHGSPYQPESGGHGISGAAAPGEAASGIPGAGGGGHLQPPASAGTGQAQAGSTHSTGTGRAQTGSTPSAGPGTSQTSAGGPSPAGGGWSESVGKGVSNRAGRSGGHDGGGGSHHIEIHGWGGEFIDLHVDEEEMATMDHEIFEPLACFDPDMTKLLEDVVNEKVKRILLLDPAKFNGRMPYGIKPAEIGDDGELDRLREQNAQLLADKAAMDEELKRLKELLKSLRQRMTSLENKEPIKEVVVVEPVHVEAPPTPVRKRSIEVPEKVVEAPPPPPPPKWNDANVQKAINEAVEKATFPLKRRIQELEEALKKAQDEADALRKELAKLKLQLEEARKELAKLKLQLEESLKRPTGSVVKEVVEKIVEVEKVVEKIVEKEKIVQKIVEKVVYKGDEDTIVAYQSSLKMLQKMLNNVQAKVDPGSESTFAAKVDNLLGKDTADWQTLSQTTSLASTKSTGGKAPKSQECYEAMPVFADWCNEVTSAVQNYSKPTIVQHVDAAVVAPPTPRTEIIHDVVVEKVSDPADKLEIARLRNRVKEQQEEISRLLLMIEEMRHRLEKMQGLLVTRGGDVAVELEKALKEVGLKDLVEAKETKKLKNVYERLYQDALQRMQRLALVLEQKAEANKLYFASLASTKKLKGAAAHAAPPDLERLTDAALMAIHGMWYHYDIMFRRVCEHSAAQGIKDSAIDNYRLALTDIFGSSLSVEDFEDLGSLRVPQAGEDIAGQNRSVSSGWGVPRPFCERAERRICNSAGAVSPGGGIAFGAQSQKGRSMRAVDLAEKEKGDFKAYMAKMKESGQAPSTPSTQLHAQRRPKSQATRPDSLTSLTYGGKRNAMSPSLSLPSLPKGLANLKVPPPSFLSPGHLLSQRTTWDMASGESSLVLQDSWMTGGLYGGDSQMSAGGLHGGDSQMSAGGLNAGDSLMSADS